MTSTEFTIGISESSRVSSKVLKPPGGGSSDIFGLGSKNESQEKMSVKATTHSRLFGNASDPPCTPPQKKNSLHQSSIFQSGREVTYSHKKSCGNKVRRNPITGEEIIIDGFPHQDKEKNDSDKEDKEEEAAETVPTIPSVPVQTSIRVRNPPGGKSSGIF